MDEDKFKDSCKYAIDIAKQFITLGVATIGFVVALALSGSYLCSFRLRIASLILLGVSVLMGIIFLMSVVAHINQANNYDVYSSMLRWLIGLQMLFFLVAILLICWKIFTPYEMHQQTKKHDINLTNGKVELSNN